MLYVELFPNVLAETGTPWNEGAGRMCSPEERYLRE
jgi:hypothetical protein